LVLFYSTFQLARHFLWSISLCSNKCCRSFISRFNLYSYGFSYQKYRQTGFHFSKIVCRCIFENVFLIATQPSPVVVSPWFQKHSIRKSGGSKCGQKVMADCSHSWTWIRLSCGTLLNDVFHESQTNSLILDEDRSETTIYVPSFATDQYLWYSGFAEAIVGRIAILIRMASWMLLFASAERNPYYGSMNVVRTGSWMEAVKKSLKWAICASYNVLPPPSNRADDYHRLPTGYLVYCFHIRRSILIVF